MTTLPPDNANENDEPATGLGRWFERLTVSILDNSVLYAIVLSAIVLTVSLGFFFLQINFNANQFYGTHDPETAYLEEYLNEWGADDLMILVVDGGESSLLTRARLDVLSEVREAVETHPLVGATRSLVDHRRPQLSFFGIRSVPLVETMPIEETSLAAWQKGVLADESIVPSLLSVDGTKSAVVLTLTVDTDDMTANRRVLNGLNERLTAYEGREGLSFNLAGIPSLRGGVIDAIVADQIYLVPTAGGSVVLLLLLMFRSRHGVLVPVLACIVPLVMLLGAMGYTNQSLGLLNQTYLILIPAIAIADAIHLVSRYHEETRRVTQPGAPHSTQTQRKAIVASMRHMGLACLFTSITTIIGFLSLGLTQMAVLQDYGLYAACGIFFAYFTVLFIVPLALSRTRKAAPLLSQNEQSWLSRMLGSCADVSFRFPIPTLLATGLLVLVAVGFGTQVEVNARFSEVLGEGHPVSDANAALDEHLGGVVGLELDLQGPKGSLADLENLKQLASLETLLAQQEGVRTVFGPAFLIRMLNEQTVGRRVLPTIQGDVEELLKLADVDSGRTILVNDDRSRGRLAVRMQDSGGTTFLRASEQLSEVASKHLSVTNLTAHLTGTTFVSYRGVNRVTSDLRNSLMGAFLIIAILISILFRSPKFGLLSLLPNTIPLILAYGAMGVMGWRLDAAPAVVFTVALGLSVDATIHVLARFNEERKSGALISEAVHEAVMHSGRAIAITSVILAVAFGVNCFSSFPDNAVFGALGSIIVLGALLANLLVLPSLLSLTFRKEQHQQTKTA